jgi:transcriptional regulator with XRE-family HTH domain
MSEQILIGPRLRAARLAKGSTLGAIADATGLTQGYLSKLERDQVSPSVASLVAICAAVGLRVGDLFEPPPSAVVRAGEGARINFGATGAREFVITPGYQNQIEVIQSFIEPGGSGGEAQYSLDCDIEFAFVLKGALEILMGNEVFALDEGDAMTLRGREPHTWRNASATAECEVIWMLAPAP